jgi:HlyD family secretion protein
MRGVWTERIAITALAVLIIGGLVWFAWPQPIPVDFAPVTRGPMEVTVDDDAKTHVRHIYTIYAPIAGTVLRISHPHGETGISNCRTASGFVPSGRVRQRIWPAGCCRTRSRTTG